MRPTVSLAFMFLSESSCSLKRTLNSTSNKQGDGSMNHPSTAGIRNSIVEFISLLGNGIEVGIISILLAATLRSTSVGANRSKSAVPTGTSFSLAAMVYLSLGLGLGSTSCLRLLTALLGGSFPFFLSLLFALATGQKFHGNKIKTLNWSALRLRGQTNIALHQQRQQDTTLWVSPFYTLDLSLERQNKMHIARQLQRFGFPISQRNRNRCDGIFQYGYMNRLGHPHIFCSNKT